MSGVIRGYLSSYRTRVRRELTAAFEEEHTPHEVAASFALGIFITAMPTGGLGLGAFVLFAYWWSWVSKTAIFASVVVLNPFVKPLVYVSSFQLGATLFGTETLSIVADPASTDVLTVVQFVLIGNVLIALALAAISYVVVLRLTTSYRRRAAASKHSSWLSALHSLVPWRRK